MKHISVIGIAGLPAKYGGFETLVENLTKYLSYKHNITVFCSSKIYSEKIKKYNNVNLKYISLKPNGVQSIFYDIISIFYSLKFADTLLILGVSGAVILPFIKIFSRKKIIVNIDGLEWKRDKWGVFSKLFLKFSEKIAVKYSDVVIADNKSIQEYVFNEYKKKSTLIAYGGDHAKKEIVTDCLKDRYQFLNKKYAFNVCRIEPENNIDMMLEAFTEYGKMNFIIIGNWVNSVYGNKLREKYSNVKNIFLLDPIYDQNVLNQIRSNCYIYIHGHSAGGTNPSLVEAMHLGLPIFSYSAEYNKNTTMNKALYFSNKEELIDLLLTVSDKYIKSIAINMKLIANDEYNWEQISTKYSNLF
ncbi:DUF1972 domain-containing protein [Campylobacter geochelonis]|uniref:Domain of uncharacterized function (DUF1972) n=1 Tax=Campylobacter geochelonis TaxID=1780362 RepID=A0A128ELA0_9BACT|nr:DUF1972 domain-containing protein [Campylobacter geochelonis]QKF71223.1 glycosyltransferase, family 4 [Campylobacter geochelonis]CZE49138.1 Domain of uncharacterised function (DUF1972) [Campylobacter geochelonis]